MYKLHNYDIEHCYSLKPQKYINITKDTHHTPIILCIEKKTNIGKKPFSFVGPKIWQDVPIIYILFISSI